MSYVCIISIMPKKILYVMVIAQNVNNLSDARFFAAAGVDWVFFSQDLWQEPNLNTIYNLIEWIEGPGIVVPFFRSKDFDCDHEKMLLVNRDSPYEDIASAYNQVACLLVGPLAQIDLLKFDFSPFDMVILKTDENFNTRHLKDLQLNQTVQTLVLDCVEPISKIKNMIEQNLIQGIMIHGGNEERPGYKSFEDQEAWVELIQELKA